MFFTDECGFSLTPCIPYGWQPVGKRQTIRSAKDWVTNLFGLLSRQGKLMTYSTLQNINSKFIVECIDEIAVRVNKPTVLVIDNAPWHTSEQVLNKQQEWAQKDVYLFFLPTYSPQLNGAATVSLKRYGERLNTNGCVLRTTPVLLLSKRLFSTLSENMTKSFASIFPRTFYP